MRWAHFSRLIGVATLFVAVSCGGDSISDPDSILISGSSTVEPISARVGEAFAAANPEVGVTVEGPGTGDGFVRFCAGETDISDASRPISDEEISACEANGIDFVELQIAADGLTVITSPENDSVSCLSEADLYALLGPESEGFNNWSDADELAIEVGGTDDFPTAPLVVTAPGEESGTYDTFVELVIAPIAEERGTEEATRADYQASANDNVIIDNVSTNPSSLGWVGFAFFEENSESLRAIAIDGGEGCIAPAPATIASFDYPLSRPLFIYVNTGLTAEKSALSEFVDFYLSPDGIGAVADAGYVELRQAEMEQTRAAWEASK